ncbi:MAG TPA: agmatinase [Solirubrobacteraceae bacterium]|jgi:agmatinase
MSEPRRAPRYTGVRTFASLAHRPALLQGELTDPPDVAVLGIPFDTATSYRPGARFGPEAIRSVSVLLRPYHPIHELDVFASQTVLDAGDVSITPGNAARSSDQIAAALEPLSAAGTVTLALGGDHSIALGELRAHAAVHGPLALVALDAHADTWEDYYGERIFHGTVFRRAVEEGILDPERSVIAGLRGSLYGPEDLQQARSLGFELITIDELITGGQRSFAARVRERVASAPAFMGFDIDVIDPSAAPGTGTPELGGLTSGQALGLLRALAGMRFVGFDVVEVSPPYDSPSQITALAAATIAYEMLALNALG